MEARRVAPVSVVVCNYNGEEYLPGCLDSVLAQGELVDEVVVVDNASEDGSLALLAERYPDVRVVRMERNEGPAPARNKGMEVARNRWVLALDNDVELEPGALARLVQAAEQEDGAVVIQPRSLFDGERERVHYDGGSLHYVGLFALRNFYRPLAEAQGDGRVEVDGAVSLALLVDREVVLGIGGYDEVYFILFEDLDLSFRLRARGHRIVSVEDARVFHKAGTAGISFREGPRYPARRVFLHSRNRWVFLLQNYRLWTLLVAAPGLAFYELLWLAFVLRNGGLGGWLKGKFAALRLLPRILAVRRRNLRGRSVGDGALLVGGPLTVTPDTARGGRSSLLSAASRALAWWWSLARVLLPGPARCNRAEVS